MRSVLVVIPTLNEAGTVEGVIKGLSNDLPVDVDVSFVVADGGSSDETVVIVQKIMSTRKDIHLVRNERRIQSAGVNLAVHSLGDTADVLVRCDAHARYPNGYIAALLQSLDCTGAESVVVPLDTVGETCFQKAVAWVADTPFGSGGARHRAGRKSGFVDHGHHAAMKIAAFQAAGMYDGDFSHNEDAEFDCRLQALGGRIFLDANIRVGYLPRKDLRSLWRQYFNYGRGRSRTVRCHPKSMRLRQAMVPAHLCLMGASLLAAAFVSPVFLAYPISALVALLIGAVILAAKKRSFCGLWSAPVALVMHTAWACGFFQGLLTIRQKPWRQQSEQSVFFPAFFARSINKSLSLAISDADGAAFVRRRRRT